MATSVTLANSAPATNQHQATFEGGVVNASAYVISKQFLLQFYAVRNRYPSELYRFYADSSQVTYPGGLNNYQITGKLEIRDVIGRMNFNGSKTVVTKLNAQFVDDEYMVILTNGHIVWQNENEPKPFHETFVLIKSSPKAFFVKNNILHLDGLDTYDPEKLPSAENLENGYTAEDDNKHMSCRAEPAVNESYPCDSTVENAIKENNNSETVENDKGWAPDVISSHQYNGGNEVKKELEEAANLDDNVDDEEGWNGDQAQEQNDAAQELEEVQPEPVIEENKLDNHDSEVNSAPKTWAMICMKNNANVPIAPSGGVQPSVVPAPSSVCSNNGEDKPVNGTGSKPRRGYRSGSNDKRNKPTGPVKNNVSAANGHPPAANMNGRRSPRAEYPEEQQLFVGNIPHWADDNQLRDFFSHYGKVLDIKVNQSSGSRQNGRNLPNYGFIVMESAEVVQKMLAQKPMMMDNHRLNVEVKKPASKR